MENEMPNETQQEYVDLSEPQQESQGFDLGLDIPTQEDFDNALGSFDVF